MFYAGRSKAMLEKRYGQRHPMRERCDDVCRLIANAHPGDT
jgi:hypothetical protein